MKKIVFIVVSALLLLSGCKVLPTTDYTVESKWNNYEDVQKSFDSVIVGETNANELQEIGFHPSATSNVKIINYLDIANLFMANDKVAVDKKVIQCINANSRCFGYSLELEDIKKDRYGSAFLDVFGFRKNTKETGWNFKAVILLLDNKVIYKLKSTQPNILVIEEKKIPLGPLQNAESVIRKAIF